MSQVMSLEMVKHKSLFDKMIEYYTDDYDGKIPPAEYMKNFFAKPSRWSGERGTPDEVKQWIYKAITRAINEKYRRLSKHEQFFYWQTHQSGAIHIVKSGKHKGREYVVISGDHIWTGGKPVWIDNQGNTVPFDKVRYLAGEIYPFVGKGTWYSLVHHRFEAFSKISGGTPVKPTDDNVDEISRKIAEELERRRKERET